VGRNQGVSLIFISSLLLQKSTCKGCKLYSILVLNEKGGHGRIRKYSCSIKVCRCFSWGITRFTARKIIVFYHRFETWN
jgi:hypothetical protein